MNNDDSVNDVDSDAASDAASNAERDLEDKDPDAKGIDQTNTPSSTRTREQEAEELSRKIAEIERKVADGN
ncbi:hypothetical protein JFU47_30640 [Pseudomonas sp. TH39(2020)]|uniref:hypothetical protein n=1 Tax=Pseudomonas sp. TH39(2020) TaxID=2796349 RepID=UPI0019131B26|nr:hypothetical protein [Pseudomonas sp. TH39(2020)]MBK5401034.1 hypothetical protein [Pseudomonas sp. TH39(2020)]